MGLFMELGPCRINDGNGTKRHAQSWNENANVFFIDQPIGNDCFSARVVSLDHDYH
jgi:cathepsin A (carboxypeptidase C)